MRTKLLKIPYAIRNERLVHISSVESGLSPDCICPCCRNPLIARKGNIKVHHFAHATETNCQPETVAHKLGILIMKERIETALASKSPLDVSWLCTECYDNHSSDILSGVSQVETECSLGTIRPDLVVLNPADQVRSIIEIVVTHFPEPAVVEYSRIQGIPIYVITISVMADLESLMNDSVITASQGTGCPRPKCDKCRRPMCERRLYAGFVDCWKCKSSMVLSFVAVNGQPDGPSEMTKGELILAGKYRANIHPCFDKYGNSEMTNQCPTCKSFTDNRHISKYAYLIEKMKGTVTGMECSRCGK